MAHREVVDASSPSRILTVYEGSELLAHLHMTANILAFLFTVAGVTLALLSTNS